MKLKLVIAVGLFAFFGLINQPFVPVPVRITDYCLVYPLSMLASGLTFWYYDSTMEVKHTILTTAVKTVIVWHTIMLTTYYGQLTTASMWSSELEEYWNNTVNQTCGTTLPSTAVGLTLHVSIFEFQVIRALLVFYPYKVVALNHDILSFPLVASVPIVAGILQMITYHNNRTFCNPMLLQQFISKLDIVINDGSFIFPNFNFHFLFHYLILFAEACIRLKSNWKDICWCKRRNTVHPSTDKSSSEMLQIATYLNPYKVGPFLMMALCFVFFQVLNLVQHNVIDLDNVIIDCVLLGLPIYWVISSDNICDFIKLKYNQWKYSLGYF